MSDFDIFDIAGYLLTPYISAAHESEIFIWTIVIILSAYTLIQISITIARKVRENSRADFAHTNIVMAIVGCFLLVLAEAFYYVLLSKMTQYEGSVIIMILKILSPILLIIGLISYKVGIDGLDENGIHYAFAKFSAYICVFFTLVVAIMHADELLQVINVSQ